MKRKTLIFVLLSIYNFLISGCIPDAFTTLKNIKPEDISYLNVNKYNESRKIDNASEIGANLAALQSINLNEKSSMEIITGTMLELIMKNGQAITINIGNGLVNFGEENYKYTEGYNPTLHGQVFLLSNSKTIEPKVMGLNSYSEGIFADMIPFSWLSPESVRAELAGTEMVPYNDDITFQCIWDFDPGKQISPLFYVYDSDMNQISMNQTELTLPIDAGLYYVVLNVSWGTYLSYVGNQYIFKIER